MKKHSKISMLMLVAFILAMSFFSPIRVLAEQQDDNINAIIKAAKQYANIDIGESLPKYDTNSFSVDVNDVNEKWSFGNIFKYIFMSLLKEIKLNSSNVLKILAIALLAALLKVLSDSFSGNTAKIAQMLCNVSMLSLVVVSLSSVVTIAIDTINVLVDFLKASLPALVSIMCISGAPTSSMLVSPALLFTSEIVASIMQNTIIPLFVVGIAFSAIDLFVERQNLTRISKLIKSTCFWAIGLIMTIFVSVTSARGIIGGVVDGVAGKTIKYAVSTFIPVVGQYLADAADTVLGGLLIMRNICGIAVLIVVVVICLIPILKIVAIAFVYKLSVVLVSPLTEQKFSDFIEESSNSMLGLAGITMCVAVMFIISVAAMLSAGANAAALR